MDSRHLLSVKIYQMVDTVNACTTVLETQWEVVGMVIFLDIASAKGASVTVLRVAAYLYISPSIIKTFC